MAKAKTVTKEIQEEFPLWEHFPEHKDICTRLGVKHSNAMDEIIDEFGFRSRRELIEAFIRIAKISIKNKSDIISLRLSMQSELLKDYRKKKE